MLLLQLVHFLLYLVVVCATSAVVAFINTMPYYTSIIIGFGTTNEWIIFLHQTTSTRTPRLTHTCVYSLYRMLRHVITMFRSCSMVVFLHRIYAMVSNPNHFDCMDNARLRTFTCPVFVRSQVNTHICLCLCTDIVDKILLIRHWAYKPSRQCDKWTY